MSTAMSRAGAFVTYRGHRLHVLTERIILHGAETTAEFYSMAEARKFVRYLERLAKEEGKSGADGQDRNALPGEIRTSGAGSRRTFDSSPSSASRRAQTLNRQAELDEAWRGW